ncbi:hypothetical protein JOD50_001159 [Pseudoglutamicibacter cumminsii]|nr:hypothetical protein [Pseudoglutamicibacter cumminsii]
MFTLTRCVAADAVAGVVDDAAAPFALVCVRWYVRL